MKVVSVVQRYACRGPLRLSRQVLLAGSRSNVHHAQRLLSSKPRKGEAAAQPPKPAQTAAPSAAPSSNPDSQASKSQNDDEDKGPQPLSRPLGVPQRPTAGENSGIDPRSWRQRREDLLDHDKHLARRKELHNLTLTRTAQVARPYFRDWTNMQYQQGKVFIAPERVFRGDKALYFPNLRGITAADESHDYDTTDVLRGRISVVSAFTGTWAQQQTESFIEKNETLQNMLGAAAATAEQVINESSSSTADASPLDMTSDPTILQHVHLNIEPSRMRHAIVKFFLYRQRRANSERQNARYFVIHKGFEQRLRERLGMFNSQVGYVFLVDAACRIRWAGSAMAEDGEVQSLNRAVARLMKEYQKIIEERERLKREGKETDWSAMDVLGDILLPHPDLLAKLVGHVVASLDP